MKIMPRHRFPMGNIPWNKGKKTGISPMMGKKHTEEWKENAKKRMIGNKYNIGKIPWNKGLKGLKFVPFGKNHYRWNPDRETVRYDRRNDPEYKQWRKQVWIRDGYKCRINNCDCKGKIEAHHILSWRDFPELRYLVNNGITLCQTHHPRVRVEEKRLIPQFQELVSVSNE